MSQLAFYVVSDVHGFIFPTDFSDRHNELPMGLLKANHLIEQDSTHYDGTIKVDNGDFLQGSPLCNYLVSELKSSRPLTDIYNRLGFSFGTIGNHEFNYGLSYLKDTIQRLDYPILCANIFENGKPFTGQGITYLHQNDVTIGVIGLTTQFIPHWEQPEYIKSLTFESAVETLKKHLPELRKHSDIVVVSYHGGFERDLETEEPTEAQTGENEASEILRLFSSDIDVLITGHQHRDIAMIQNQTAVIQPGTRGTKVGKMVLNIESQNDMQVESCTLLNVEDDSNFEIEPQDLKLRTHLENWLDEKVATLPTSMRVENAFEARVKPHPFINLLNYILLESSGADIACTALFDSAKGFDTDITMRDIINNYPFPNTFKVLELSGNDIKRAIERSASYFDLHDNKISVSADFLEPKPQHFNYDIFAGVHYTINVSRPYGERVSELSINGQPLDENKTYTICVNNYRAVGGGNYDMYADKTVVKDIQIDGAQLLINYLSNNDLSHIPQVVNFEVVK
ncbi:bifunctional metallophosphatase/5'-nucleotidase [Staphylococcus caprae]|uniref:bifunctional metallophosphatase/5'-nucleotidase n=1 Tax=Staphylococcus caprae TaxID=29380 RepID=UPI000BA6AE87|nr:bifunctional UDP-sugar hydrolase/5'-nucleotidase [Staphylococcus caprae]PAK63744.1 bifunctional metallophosphatase/5'-nucleotidase [Staphylococcus caprae]